jgi:hypothetical protein
VPVICTQEAEYVFPFLVVADVQVQEPWPAAPGGPMAWPFGYWGKGHGAPGAQVGCVKPVTVVGTPLNNVV